MIASRLRGAADRPPRAAFSAPHAAPEIPRRTRRPRRLNSEPDPGAAERPSKTALKRHMHELQELGEALMTLPDERIDAIGLPESLREAVRDAQRTKSFEGRRRQIQYLGKLMRRADAQDAIAPIREAVAAFRLGHARDALALHEAERWRAELIADDAALERWVAAHPATDVQALRSLIRNARKEAAATPPAAPGAAARQGRGYRELFQRLRAILNQAEETDETPHE